MKNSLARWYSHNLWNNPWLMLAFIHHHILQSIRVHFNHRERDFLCSAFTITQILWIFTRARSSTNIHFKSREHHAIRFGAANRFLLPMRCFDGFFLGAIISQWLHNATNHFVLVSPREFIKIDNSFAALFFLTLIMEKFLLELKT